MDLDRLKCRKIINAMKLGMTKCQILYLGWSNAGHKSKLGEEWLENSPEKRVWGFWLTGNSKRVSCADPEVGQTINTFPGDGVNNSILKRRVSYSIPYSATVKSWSALRLIKQIALIHWINQILLLHLFIYLSHAFSGALILLKCSLV